MCLFYTRDFRRSGVASRRRIAIARAGTTLVSMNAQRARAMRSDTLFSSGTSHSFSMTTFPRQVFSRRVLEKIEHKATPVRFSDINISSNAKAPISDLDPARAYSTITTNDPPTRTLLTTLWIL
jgi:hypothetical protein